MVSALLFFIALLLMLAAVLAVLHARRVEQIEKVTHRLQAVAFLDPEDASSRQAAQNEAMKALSRWLSRVGIQISPLTALMLLLLVVVGGVLILKTWDGMAAAAWWGLTSLISVVIPQIRYRQKMNKLVSQIPLFIDQIIRGLVTGRNVEGAIKLAAEDLQEPLREVVMRAQRTVELGADLGEALRDAAEFHDIKELHMLALAIHTSRTYGGSPREMLESIVKLIRQREQMQRELSAMTGETRISAWVLGALPSLLGVYMIFANPGYMSAMWNDPSGQKILLAALGMQATGAIVLWRMVKSV